MDNERIRDIAKQCITDGTFDLGKFANFLINDCLNVVHNVVSPHATTTFDLAQHQGSISQVKIDIKKHFNIE
jgi:hypothetical protein